MDYKNGKIYRLVCNKTGLVYYGSTTQPLYKRKWTHKGLYNLYTKGDKTSYVSSFEIIKNGDYDIILVEDYPCDNKEQLNKRERFFIENNDCVNRVIPTRTKQEYDVLYRKIHNLKRQEQNKTYREQHKEKYKQYSRDYYNNHKHLLFQKNMCDCGKMYSLSHKKRHEESSYHQKRTT